MLAMTESRLWVLDRQVFQAIMMTTGIRRQEETMKFLRRLRICLYIGKPKRLVSPDNQRISRRSVNQDVCWRLVKRQADQRMAAPSTLTHQY